MATLLTRPKRLQRRLVTPTLLPSLTEPTSMLSVLGTSTFVENCLREDRPMVQRDTPTLRNRTNTTACSLRCFHSWPLKQVVVPFSYNTWPVFPFPTIRKQYAPILSPPSLVTQHQMTSIGSSLLYRPERGAWA